MATTFTDTLFSTKYKDDFADSDGYYRILFNSGRALQARELTQMQTIINKQVERFGNNIFKEGAVVKPGGLAIDNAYEFVKLDPTSTSFTATVGDVLTGGTSGIKAEVLEIVDAAGGDPATFYIRYVNTSASSTTSTTPRFQAGESLGSGRIVQITNTTTNPAIGRGTRATVGESVYFTQGFFVYTEAQTALISKYSDVPTADVGFKITQDVVSVDDDVALYDNQGAVPNQTAPGADRYRILLTLTTKDSITSGQNFIHVATVKEGVIFQAVEAATNLQYNIPRDLVATRIKENSGDYIVKPFRISFDEDSQNTHLLLKVSDGIVVVDGYRAARFAPTDLRIKKPASTHENKGEFTAINYGNYVDVLRDSVEGGPDLRTFEVQELRDAKGFGGSKIGSARVRAVHENGNDFRYHLFDINMDAGKSFRDAKSIGTATDHYFNPIQSGSNTILQEPLNNSLIFDLPFTRPRTIDASDFEVQFHRRGTTDASGNLVVTIPSSYGLDNAGDWLFFTDSGALSNVSLTGLNIGSNTTTVGNLPPSTPIRAYVYGSISSPVVRAKILTQNATVTTTIQTDSAGKQFIDLGQPDIFKVTRMRINDSDGNDLLNKFTLDNGQRDNFYDIGRMVLNAGQTAPSGNVYVKFDHFEHTNGNFFAANSYTGVVDYDQIPNHTLATGREINLRDVLDFRPVKNTRTSFLEAEINPLPQPRNLVTSDNTYFLPRSYKLVIDKDANLSIVNGDAAFNPTPPQTPDGTLALYNFTLGANTLNTLDVSVEKIDRRRYTMHDIGRLDNRITKLEELASLSMLELNTSNFEVLDSAGLNRTKSGFFVDNFTTHVLSDVNAPDYRASIDPLNGLMRPIFSDDNIRLIFDSDNSTSVVRRGDNIYLNYSEVKEIEQPFATQAVKINPFTTSVYEGNLVLSPASDEWHDRNVVSRDVIDGGSKLSTVRAYNWDNWEWNWGGIALEDLEVGDATNTITTKDGRAHINTVNKIVDERIVEEVIGEKVLQVSMLPFMRSRIIHMKARGLRPNTNVFLFFSNKLMLNFVREETFVRYSEDTKDFGNTLRDLTEHKDGSTALTTDASGAVDISFMLPNNSTHRFRAGTHEVKILDIDQGKEEFAGTTARAIYTAQGFLDTIHQDVKSTRVLEVEGRKSVTRTAVSYNNDNGDDGSGNEGKGVSWLDPTNKGSALEAAAAVVNNLYVPFTGRTQAEVARDSGTENASRVLCTEYYRQGKFSLELYKMDMEYSDIHISPTVIRGYHAWAIDLVKYIRKNPDGKVAKFFEYGTHLRAELISQKLNKPVDVKRNVFEKALAKIIYHGGHALCYGIGLFAKQKDYNELYGKVE